MSQYESNQELMYAYEVHRGGALNYMLQNGELIERLLQERGLIALEDTEVNQRITSFYDGLNAILKEFKFDVEIKTKAKEYKKQTYAYKNLIKVRNKVK
jgi:hypothetical protein